MSIFDTISNNLQYCDTTLEKLERYGYTKLYCCPSLIARDKKSMFGDLLSNNNYNLKIKSLNSYLNYKKL